jgi:hypothetical protein
MMLKTNSSIMNISHIFGTHQGSDAKNSSRNSSRVLNGESGFDDSFYKLLKPEPYQRVLDLSIFTSRSIREDGAQT